MTVSAGGHIEVTDNLIAGTGFLFAPAVPLHPAADLFTRFVHHSCFSWICWTRGSLQARCHAASGTDPA